MYSPDAEHGDLPSAAAAAQEMLGLSEHTGGEGRAIALALAGYVAMETGDFASAIASLAESLISVLLDQGETAAARDRWQQARQRTRTRELAVLNLALLGYAAAIAAAGGQHTRAVILAQVAARLQTETGWENAQLLESFWRILAPPSKGSAKTPPHAHKRKAIL